VLPGEASDAEIATVDDGMDNDTASLEEPRALSEEVTINTGSTVVLRSSLPVSVESVLKALLDVALAVAVPGIH
jgi:hypothetical protein